MNMYPDTNMCFYPVPVVIKEERRRRRSSRSTSTRAYYARPAAIPAPATRVSYPDGLTANVTPMVLSTHRQGLDFTPPNAWFVNDGIDHYTDGGAPILKRNVPENVGPRHEEISRDTRIDGMLEVMADIKKECATNRDVVEDIKRELELDIGRREAERVARQQQKIFDEAASKQWEAGVKHGEAEVARKAAKKAQVEADMKAAAKLAAKLAVEEHEAERQRSRAEERGGSSGTRARGDQEGGRIGDFVDGWCFETEPHHNCRACHIHYPDHPDTYYGPRAAAAYPMPPPMYDPRGPHAQPTTAYHYAEHVPRMVRRSQFKQ